MVDVLQTDVRDPVNVSRQPRVWLCISSYHDDDAIRASIENVLSQPRIFERILVVDSKGTGVIPKLIRDRDWSDVEYYSADTNLGSAGNLSKRLELAAQSGVDYAFTVNSDTSVDVEVVKTLLNAATKIERPGAVYPLSYFEAANAYNLTGISELALRARRVRSVPEQALIDVHWSSSNGALYALEPVSSGLSPRAELWMGWEDLEYGWQLSDHGYRQVIVIAARFKDSEEYKTVAGVSVVDKPVWRSYYSSRNLIHVVMNTRPSFKFIVLLVVRLAAEVVASATIRSNRLSTLSRGFGMAVVVCMVNGH
jgi:hypothetical protein